MFKNKKFHFFKFLQKNIYLYMDSIIKKIQDLNLPLAQSTPIFIILLCRLQIGIYNKTNFPRKYTDNWYELYSYFTTSLMTVISILMKQYTTLSDEIISLIVSIPISLHTIIKAWYGKYYKEMGILSGKPSLLVYSISILILYFSYCYLLVKLHYNKILTEDNSLIL